MGFNGRARLGVAGLLVGGLAALTAGGALADANSKNARNNYNADAASSGGITLTDDLGPVAGVDVAGLAPGTVAIGSTSSNSNTDRGGSDGHASASALRVMGQPVGGSAECDAVGDTGTGEVSDSHQTSLQSLDAGLARVDLLPASCDARAVKSNNASGTASAAVAVVEVDGVASADVLASESSNKTTSGQSHSDSSFTVLSVQAAGQNVDVVQCTSSSRDNNGTESHSSSVSPVSGVDLPVACPLAESSATYTK